MITPHTAPLPPADEAVRRKIAQATLSLRRYRTARDHAQLRRLKASPRLQQVIATLLSPAR